MIEGLFKPENYEAKEQSEEEDELDKEEILKEWRKSQSCYSLNHEDFKFRISDM